MGKNKEDLRIIKTRSKLDEALMELVNETSIDQIKVSDLCDKAGISRATFYNNFDSVMDVYRYHLNNKFGRLRSILHDKEKSVSLTPSEKYDCYMGIIVDSLTENKAGLLHLLRLNSVSVIFDAFYSHFNSEFLEFNSMHAQQVNAFNMPSDVLLSSIAGAITGIIVSIRNNPSLLDQKDELRHILYTFTFEIYSRN